MLESSFGMFFFLKTSKSKKAKSHYIYIRITVDKSSVELSTKRTWVPSKWNSRLGRATGKTEDDRILNTFLDSYQFKVLQAKKHLMDTEKEISAINLKNVLLGITDDRKMILELFQEHNERMESLVGKEFAHGTFKRYMTAFRHTRSFIQWKFGKPDIEIRKLDYEFLADFSYWFRSVKNCSHNTTVKYLIYFKKIVLLCVKKGWILRDPFIDFNLASKEVIREILTKEELDLIKSKEFSIFRLDNVRDIFLFSCYTGLAYIDVKNLKRQQIINGIDGEKWIFTQRQKTQSPTRLPLLPKALEIVEKYKDHAECLASGNVLPVLSNQKMNAYLKEIADICGIEYPYYLVGIDTDGIDFLVDQGKFIKKHIKTFVVGGNHQFLLA
ncbi:site-specific integrase [Belliella sp. DSM 107340]|uniref:Site-specific integrase n=1 Tax=Belliella calami TaxID=2923436 RepID=A0ABS9UN31_9BACT|nr:site-specific integrase [Belliella calami]MCH7398021.1 site-specific integrase [Belliella calami]